MPSRPPSLLTYSEGKPEMATRRGALLPRLLQTCPARRSYSMRSPTQVMSHGWLRPDTTVVTWSVGAASAVGVGWTASAPPATRAPTRAIDPRTRSRCTMVTPRLGDLLALLARLRASGQVRASRDLRDVGCGDRRSVPVTTRVSAESHSSERPVPLEWPRR